MGLRVVQRPFIHAGIFVLCLSTLMFEVLLTRIFSVSLWYHFAFLAISVAMFGMTAAALAVHGWPRVFDERRAPQQLAWSGLGFAASVVLSVRFHLSFPVSFTPSLVGIGTMALTYLVCAVPFFCSGLAVCIALTRFSPQAGTLYAADLGGAASGCVLVIGVLEAFGAPGAVRVVALVSLTASVLFAWEAGFGLVTRAAVLAVASALALAFALVPAQDPNASAARPGRPVLHTKWNSFSRVQVTGDPQELTPPFAWALSPAYRHAAEPLVPQLTLAIDSMAGTVLTRFTGDLEAVDYLRYDLVNLVHYLRADASVLVVGTGGGRDVLTALVFRQRRVVGVEINEDILATANGRFGDFTGHLERYPQVEFVNDDARSYLAGRPDKYDIIQISMIDTWAATAAGAFALTENSLYTLEAWRLFLERLTPSGILTASRWYSGNPPAEIYRMTALAAAALRARGVSQPREHLVVVRNAATGDRAVGTILVSPTPWSARDLDRLDDIVGRLGFEIVASPRVAGDATVVALAGGEDPKALTARLRFNVAPPTDDTPFFFQMLRLRDVFDPEAWQPGRNSFNLRAVVVLVFLLALVIVLTGGCLILPLSALRRTPGARDAAPLALFFASVGLGFMLIEGACLQRLIIFLGHPTYSLSVVLFTLLSASALGAAVGGGAARAAGAHRLAWLLVALGLTGLLLPQLERVFAGASTGVRIGLAALLMTPAGFGMGMAVPLGLGLASERVRELTPWLWAINGATSVCGSVLGVTIALGAGISAAFWTGWLCYLVAFGAAELASMMPKSPSHSSRRESSAEVEIPRPSSELRF